MAGHEYVATYTATDLNKSAGRVLDDASRGMVEIKRRGATYVMLRSDRLDQLLRDARQDRPRDLADLLDGYDAEKIKSVTSDFLNASPAGKERI